MTTLLAGKGGLAETALVRLKSTLAEGGSFPSSDSEDALASLLRTMEDGLNGRLPPKFYLSSIDPGMGKTRAVASFLGAWADGGFKPNAGVLICVSRLKEIEDYVRALGLSPTAFAVLTSDDRLNALGRSDHANAPILFIAQQRVTHRNHAGTGWDYRGQPRALKVWDESFDPAEQLVLSRDDLGLVMRERYRVPRLVPLIEALFDQLKSAVGGSVVSLTVDLVSAARDASRHASISDDARRVVETIVDMGVSDLLTVDERGGGKALAGVRFSLPPTFAPVIILDASGRLRATYRLWERSQSNLVRLPTAANDYGRVEINVWRRSNGREAFLKGPLRTELLAELAKLINDDDLDEPWLIVRYKSDPTFDADLKALVHRDAERRVVTLSWGSHFATNDYRHISNVVVTGQLTYRRSHYLALALAVSGLHPSDVSTVDLGELTSGEHLHHIFQAVGRSTMRQSVAGRAGAAKVYMTLTPGQPPTEGLKTAFPGAVFKEWKARDVALRGVALRAAKLVVTKLSDPDVTKVAKKEVREALGIPNSSTFAKNVVGHSGFQTHIAALGIVIRHRHFERVKASAVG